ncbi:MAG: energy-coupling factor transporter transmembrane component T [Bryobacterales bacterium]|nr:energy-coupling factor transporter transmembrane component T [Bryobacterales bacterium]
MRPLEASLEAPASPLARADPRIKLCAVLCTVLLISTFPPGADWRCAAISGILALVGLAARVPALYVLRRLLAATPFIALAAALPVAAGLPAGGAAAFAVAWKACSAILLLSMLAATTLLEDIVDALRRLGVPRAFALTLVLMHRYLFLLLEEWRAIARARECRTGGRVRSGFARVWANHAAMVFVRGWDRAESVAQALLARGFQGDFPRLGRARLSLPQAACGAALPAAIALLRIA